MEAATMPRSKSDELRESAGEAVGAMPQDPPADPLPDVDEIRVDGTGQLDMFGLGGKQADSADLGFSGKVKLVAGEGLAKGDRIRFTGEAIVRTGEDADKVDKKTGLVVSCTRHLKAELVDLSVVSSS